MKIKVSFDTWIKMHKFLLQNYCTSSDYKVSHSGGLVELEFFSSRCFDLVEHYWSEQYIVSDRGGDFS